MSPKHNFEVGILPGTLPHDAVDKAFDGLADGAKSVIGAIAGGLKGGGEELCRALDGPIKETLNIDGPHRIPDALLDGVVDAVSNAYRNGLIESLKIYGDSIKKALDEPPKLIGKIR